MTWKKARMIALQHLARLQIPRRLEGITMQITEYDDEDTLRFLKAEEPDLTLESQRMINQAFIREVRKRGARIQSVPVRINDYFAWLAKYDLPNNAGNRAQYISWLTCPEPKATPIK
jgi:hypothetical protein